MSDDIDPDEPIFSQRELAATVVQAAIESFARGARVAVAEVDDIMERVEVIPRIDIIRELRGRIVLAEADAMAMEYDPDGD